MDAIENDEEEVKESILGKVLFCQNCSQNVKFSTNWTIHATKNLLSLLEKPSIDTILSKLLKDATESHRETLNCTNPYFQSSGHEKMLIMSFETPNRIRVPNKISFQGKQYVFASQVSQNKDNSLRTAFEYKTDLYYNVHMDLPKKTIELSQKNILLIVYKQDPSISNEKIPLKR